MQRRLGVVALVSCDRVGRPSRRRLSATLLFRGWFKLATHKAAFAVSTRHLWTTFASLATLPPCQKLLPISSSACHCLATHSRARIKPPPLSLNSNHHTHLSFRACFPEPLSDPSSLKRSYECSRMIPEPFPSLCRRSSLPPVIFPNCGKLRAIIPVTLQVGSLPF